MQPAGSRTFQKHFTTKKQHINFTSLKLIGYSSPSFKKEKQQKCSLGWKSTFFKKPKDVSIMLLVVGK